MIGKSDRQAKILSLECDRTYKMKPATKATFGFQPNGFGRVTNPLRGTVKPLQGR